MPKPSYSDLMDEVKQLREAVAAKPEQHEPGERPAPLAVKGKLKAIVRTQDIATARRLAQEALDRL